MSRRSSKSCLRTRRGCVVPSSARCNFTKMDRSTRPRFSTRRRHLQRREEPLQTSDPAQFLDLLGDPRFEAPIELRYLIGALAQFLEQPRVLDRDHRLAGEIPDQLDLL